MQTWKAIAYNGFRKNDKNEQPGLIEFDILIIMEIHILYSIRAIFCPFFVQDKG